MIQVTKVWWDGEKLMAEPIDPAAIYKEPEQPAQQQEPVECANGCRGFVKHSTPAQRTWVGLTDKEKREARNAVSYSPLAMTMGEWTEAVQDATETKLKEKNT